jgi:hypothetical protein
MPTTMGRKKPTPEETPHERPKRTGRPVQVYLSVELYDRVQAYLASARPKPSLTSMVETALEDLLVKLERGGG